jgi:phosphate transport system substrate-binding protein
MTKRLIVLTAAVAAVLVAPAAASATSKDTTITGAGSTFVQPLVNSWTPALGNAFGYSVQYSGVGSGAGIAAITNKQVDFGASDAPLTPAQQEACADCVQIPWALSGIAVAYNAPGAPVHLNLDGATISKIFLGQITNWGDPAIKALNKGANMPDLRITPIFRSDGSGSSYALTDYLSSVNGDWKNRVGVSTQPAFPAGQGARGSSGVAGLISRTPGAIGYVDVAYALKNHIKFFRVQNAAKKFVAPGIRAIQSAASLIKKVPANNEMHIVDPPAKGKYANAYPICTFTYAILQKSGTNAETKAFVKWAVTKGQTVPGAQKFLFVAIPKLVQTKSQKTLSQVH